jgi:membrane protein implicated in regulation of membrane protease activity
MADLVFWHWWVLAVVCFGLEAFAPGAIFLWLGVAAGIVGAVMFFVPTLDWEVQLLAFASLSLVTILAWRAYQRHHPTETEQPLLNRRGWQYVGHTFTLPEPIVNGEGKINVDDTIWRVRGQDAPAGALVEVTGVDGIILKVEPRPR